MRPRGLVLAAVPAVLLPVLAGCAGTAPAPTTEPSAATTTRPAATASPTPGRTAATARYVFPVRAAATFGRYHHDYPATDIFAACGSPVLAPTSGTIDEVSTEDVWNPATDDGATRGGLSFALIGDDGVRYYGSHLSRLDPGAVPGRRVAAGAPIGLVGNTGDARGIHCHLHFGISPDCGHGDWWVRRGAVSPFAYLTAWKRGRPDAPAAEVATWKQQHGCPRTPAAGPYGDD